MTVNHDVPIGHKVALVDFAEGDTVTKYGQDIGVLLLDQGYHINPRLKTKRW